MLEIKDDMVVDLHIHTNASDGTWSPVELVYELKKNNISIFAVTDHDTVKNIAETKRLAKENGLLFLHGAEFSSTFLGEWFHILGYGFDLENKGIKDLMAYNQRLMEEKDEKSIKFLIEKGFGLDYKEFESYKHENKRGGWKALNFLIDKGICRDVYEYFNVIFTKDIKAPLPVFCSPEIVIDKIKKAGGVPVLAHPSYGESSLKLEFVLKSFIDMGISGVECYHPNHSEQVTRQLVKYCDENDLIITGGSDCHGSFITKRALGKPRTLFTQIKLKELEKEIL